MELESQDGKPPKLTEEMLQKNNAYTLFVKQHRSDMAAIDYKLYRTAEAFDASTKDEVFRGYIESEKAQLVSSADLVTSAKADPPKPKKVARKKKPMKFGLKLVIFVGGFALLGVGAWGMFKMGVQKGQQQPPTAVGEKEEGGMIIPEQLHLDEDAEQITVTIDRSYSAVPAEDLELKGSAVDGVAQIELPAFDKTDFFSHVPGYSWGFTSDPDGKKIEYYGGETYGFSENIKLYRVLVKYGGGNGTREDPYLINYYDQLELMAQENARGYFKQIADIVFPDYAEHTPIDTTNELKDDPDSEHFEYDGNGYSISGLDAPLFGKVSGALIQNVNIKDSSILTYDYEDIGLLVRDAYNFRYTAEDGKTYETGETVIKHCSVAHCSIAAGEQNEDVQETTTTVVAPAPPGLTDGQGNVATPPAPPAPMKHGEYAIGGLTGVGGDISDCYVTDLTLSAYLDDYYMYVGGISGKPANVRNSGVYSFSADGKIFSAGGIAGSAGGARMYDAEGNELPDFYGGNIQGCFVRSFTATCEVSAGGIVAEATTNATNALISNCYATGLTFACGVFEDSERTEIVSEGITGGIIGEDAADDNGHLVTNIVSPAELLIIGEGEKSSYDDTVRQAPAEAFYQNSILSVLNKNTVDPEDPDVIFTGSFKFGQGFGDENGTYAYPEQIDDLIARTQEGSTNG